MTLTLSKPALINVHLVLYGGLAALSPVGGQADAALASLALAAGLIAASIVDMRRFFIPDTASLGLVLAGLAAVAWFRPENLGAHALTAALWYLLLAAISELYLRWRGRDGLGLGDAKLMAAAGAWLGPEGSAAVLLYAAIGGIIAVAGFLARRGFRVPEPDRIGIAFGPFIALSIWIVWLYGRVW